MVQGVADELVFKFSGVFTRATCNTLKGPEEVNPVQFLWTSRLNSIGWLTHVKSVTACIGYLHTNHPILYCSKSGGDIKNHSKAQKGGTKMISSRLEISDELADNQIMHEPTHHKPNINWNGTADEVGYDTLCTIS